MTTYPPSINLARLKVKPLTHEP